MLYCIVFGMMFVVFGTAFGTGKLLNTVPGWKQMTEEEQGYILALPLCRNIGFVVGIAGAILLVGGFLPSFRETLLIWAMIGWFVLCIADLVFINKSKRYIHPKK